MGTIELIQEIEKAFDGVEWSSTSLRQFVLTDKFGLTRDITVNEWNQAGKSRVDTKWQEIPDSEIDDCNCMLAHMEANEFRYFLPAYLRFSVKNYQKSIWETYIIGSVVYSLYPTSKNPDLYIYKVKQLSLLNNAQKIAAVSFLKFVATLAGYVQRPNAEKALERYWQKNIPINL